MKLFSAYMPPMTVSKAIQMSWASLVNPAIIVRLILPVLLAATFCISVLFWGWPVVTTQFVPFLQTFSLVQTIFGQLDIWLGFSLLTIFALLLFTILIFMTTYFVYVLKADGLAAGKGVLIIQDLEEAKNELRNMLVHAKFGNASSKFVIEEFLGGIELSCFVLTDGKNYKILPTPKDYKRIGEGDTGLNTGGMGAVSPVPFADEVLLHKIEERIVKPTILGLPKDIEYKGFVFIGLINVKGEPMVIEYNVRMGDPETEVVLPRIKTDLVELFQAVANEKLDEVSLEVDERSATTIMIVAVGYPEDYEKGFEISGLENITDSIVFHAGTKIENGKVVTSGGRVLAITAYGNSFEEALKKSYQNIEKLHFYKMNVRKDIGKDLS